MKMISMATPTILSALESDELGKYGIIILILLLSAAEIFNANSDIDHRFAPFIKICSVFINPLLMVLIMITITKVLIALWYG